MEALSKKYLRRKLAGHPFLCLLVQDTWFRLGCLGFILLLVSLGLFLPRIWTASPPGFLPVVKVSGLDLAQAWSLKRSARQAMAAGRFDDAHYAWMAALANNSADASLLRGSLECASTSANRRKYQNAVVPQALWLLRLCETNRNDLERVAKVLFQYGHFEKVAALLEPRQEELTPPLEAVYLKALFRAGRADSFIRRWRRTQASLPPDEELSLCHSAWIAGWSATDPAADAVCALEQSLEKTAHGILSCRLLLVVGLRRMDAARCREMLARLHTERADTLPEHVEYWRLLAQLGHKAEAMHLAESLPCPPASADEVMAFAQLYREWGLREHALGVFRRWVADFGGSAEVWAAYSRTLLELRDWDELRRVALQIRVRAEGGQETLTAYSFYLEGRADLGLQRRFHARSAFQKMAEWEFHPPHLGLEAAKDLILLDYPDLAEAVLLKLEDSLHSSAEYWSLRFQIAEKLKQADRMLFAARRAHELRPKEPALANNYAAALLICRESPAEAIWLTWRVLMQTPHAPSAQISHAAALLLNQRTEEALALLAAIDPSRLTDTQLVAYHLNRFEACLKLQRTRQAWACSDSIDPQHLYPPQAQWLEEARKSLPPRKTGESAILILPGPPTSLSANSR
ncbi:MAG: hypothetical protein FJ398_25040 [Verrucomicrobia bacterium]|nr:hypothetical protein [Verrucomicrobiota bacterium]